MTDNEKSNEAACKVGFWAALLCACFSITYIVAQLFEWQGYLGSQGGPEVSSTPFGIARLLTPC